MVVGRMPRRPCAPTGDGPAEPPVARSIGEGVGGWEKRRRVMEGSGEAWGWEGGRSELRVDMTK